MNHERYGDKLATKIVENFESHGVRIKINSWKQRKGRYIFAVELKKGTKESSIFKCYKDIQAKLKLPLFQPIKRGLSIHIVVSIQPITENRLSKMLENPRLTDGSRQIPYAVGYDALGDMCIVDIAEMPHLLMAGSTNSGKSVALRNLIMSIIWSKSENDVNLLILDIGAYDLKIFKEVPHLSHPIVEDPETGLYVMMALKAEMERRISIKK